MTIKVQAETVVQHDTTFYLFRLKASTLWSIAEINQRSEDKDEGYQRALSESRVKAISNFILGGGVIPGAIVVSLDKATFDETSHTLTIPEKKNAAWVIDGQHRLAGAHVASATMDIDLCVIAFVQLPVEQQVGLFVTINREAKGVPSSLYIDLLKHLPKKKSDKELQEERISDIARTLNSDESSPFFQAIAFTKAPKAGDQVSLVNFARVMRQHIGPNGTLSVYTATEQNGVISNYFRSLEVAFPKIYEDGTFLKTLGFGAVWRAFPLVFQLSIKHHKGFTVQDVSQVFKKISDFDFAGWKQFGTGTAAETQAGDDLRQKLHEAFDVDGDGTGALRL